MDKDKVDAIRYAFVKQYVLGATHDDETNAFSLVREANLAFEEIIRGMTIQAILDGDSKTHSLFQE